MTAAQQDEHEPLPTAGPEAATATALAALLATGLTAAAVGAAAGGAVAVVTAVGVSQAPTARAPRPARSIRYTRASQLLEGLGLSREASRAILDAFGTTKVETALGVGGIEGQVRRDAPWYRAWFLVNAAKRVHAARKAAEQASKADGASDLDRQRRLAEATARALERERAWWRAHRQAEIVRRQNAAALDAAQRRYGPLLGWYAVLDKATTPACRAADGANFYANRPPHIGWPGVGPHLRCRCWPGKPHATTRMVDDAHKPRPRPT